MFDTIPREMWEKIATRAIELGMYEEISEKGYRSAVKNVAYRMFLIVAQQVSETIQAGRELDENEYPDELIAIQDKLDEIVRTIAVASKTHPLDVWADIDRDLAAYCDQYVEGFQK